MKNYLIAIAILAVCWLLSIDVVQEKGFELFYFFENVISKNIEKLKERYKPN